MPAMALTAKRLIEENGRACTFARSGRAPTDSSKPWRASTGGTPLSYADIKAVITPMEWDARKGEVSKYSTATVLVAHDSFPDIEADTIRSFDIVNDGLQTWRVQSAVVLMPGVTPVIYQFKVEC